MWNLQVAVVPEALESIIITFERDGRTGYVKRTLFKIKTLVR